MSEAIVQDQTQQPVDPAQSTPQIPEGFVSQDVFERTKKDMIKHKEEAKRLKEEFDNAKLQRLKETQNWEAVAKQKEEEALSEKSRREKLEASIVQHQKFISLKTEALKHNMHPSSLDDLELLDLPEINVETTSTGKILVHGADKAIQNLKTLRPHWFQQKASAINPQSPETIQVQSNQVTMQDLARLESEYKKNPSDKTKLAYFEAIKKFKTS